ncbi:MAG: UDP-N-acetylmuramyl peptide synthase, partial [Gemmatimonadaceae bacterium]|nr:UDP-N-acetylmuramyl peptide synthase [Gemmatimonadaceae bacterium]
SMRAALALLDQVGGTRQRVAILGSMRELGAQSDQQHREVARAALASSADVIAAVGDFAAAFAAESPNDPRVVASAEFDAIWPRLQPRLRRDAVMLLKASRGMKLERLVPLITTWATTPDASA